jgi:pyruvate formate lyase activating enzyme
MNIIGFQKCSLVDYPGRMAAVIFTPGCNMDCFFCHNRRIVSMPAPGALYDNSAVLRTLRERVGFLDSVVITGGEPTLQKGLESFIRGVRALGYAVKLDTNGSNPEVLSRLIRDGLLNYVAMDIKAPRARYAEMCGSGFDLNDVDASIQILMQDFVEYEFRTTVIPQLAGEDLLTIARWIRGARRYVLQQYRPLAAGERGNDARCAAPAHAPAALWQWARMIRPFVQHCETRGLGPEIPVRTGDTAEEDRLAASISLTGGPETTHPAAATAVSAA